jgi:uncharacterized membrane protein
VIERLRASFSDRRIAIVASLVLLSLFVLGMLVGRVLYTRTLDNTSIAWNLVLAWVPFLVALVVYVRASSASVASLVGLSSVWLLFFPNAPYIVTDLKHIGTDAGIPVLYDVLLLSAAAWTGLLLGLTSLFLMHGVARRFLGVVNAWAVVVVVLVLSSFGVYLGRVQRWNSWDVFTRPGALLGDVTEGLHPRPLALTVLFTSFLLATYLVLYAFARLSSFVRE